MNLKPTKTFVVVSVSILSVLFLGWNVLVIEQQVDMLSQESSYVKDQKSGYFKTLEYLRASPDASHYVISYKLDFNTALFNDFQIDYFSNSQIIAVRDADNNEEDYIFTGSGINEPHWLGNDFIFFTSNCGYSCFKLYLVNVFSKETKLATLTEVDDDSGALIYTQFQDWFGRSFKLEGSVRNTISENTENKSWLIFQMEGNKGQYLDERKFLFDGSRLSVE